MPLTGITELLSVTVWPQVDILEKQEKIPGEIVIRLFFAGEEQMEPISLWTVCICCTP